MLEVQILVTLQVEECDTTAKIDRATMRHAAKEAVRNAIQFANDNGFSHARANDLSIGFVDAIVYHGK